MSFLVDTNVLSELRKGQRRDPHVDRWYSTVRSDDLFLSALALGEVQRGIERARGVDAAKAVSLNDWLTGLRSRFSDHILPVDLHVALEWGRLSALRTVPVIDGLMAVTARVHDMVLVTRNERDVAGLGVRALNPFSPV